jgi:hypothetical protein
MNSFEAEPLTPKSHKAERRQSTRSISTQKSSDLAHKVNKSRNLAFFLLDLSEFVMEMWLSHELAYLLTKYASLTLNSCLAMLTK